MKLRFGLGREQEDEMTQKEVADLLGISQSYISRLEKKIISRLRREIKKMDYAAPGEQMLPGAVLKSFRLFDLICLTAFHSG